MLAAAQGEGFTAAADHAAAAGSARGRGSKRKRSDAAEGLGLIAAAAAAAAAGQGGGIVGPLCTFAESQDAAVGCKRYVCVLQCSLCFVVHCRAVLCCARLRSQNANVGCKR
jgi:hypothetical protein